MPELSACSLGVQQVVELALSNAVEECGHLGSGIMHRPNLWMLRVAERNQRAVLGQLDACISAHAHLSFNPFQAHASHVVGLAQRSSGENAVETLRLAACAAMLTNRHPKIGSLVRPVSGIDRTVKGDITAPDGGRLLGVFS
jgi:hypothetical protein